MAFYKRFGAIEFLSQSKQTVLLHSQHYWIIKPKIEENNLQKILKINNECSSLVWIKYHQEEEESACCIVAKDTAMWVDLKNKVSIGYFCNIVEGLVRSYLGREECGGFKFDVNQIMFFQIKALGEVKYFNFYEGGFGGNGSLSKKQGNYLMEKINKFLDDKFGHYTDISFRLLISKLKKCTQISQILDEIAYFQNIYDLKKQKKKTEQDQKKIIFKKRNRSYRKNSLYSQGKDKQSQKRKLSFRKQASQSSHQKGPKIKNTYSSLHIHLTNQQTNMHTPKKQTQSQCSKRKQLTTTQRKLKIKMFKPHKQQQFWRTTSKLISPQNKTLKKQKFFHNSTSSFNNSFRSTLKSKFYEETQNFVNMDDQFEKGEFDINEIVNDALSRWENKQKINKEDSINSTLLKNVKKTKNPTKKSIISNQTLQPSNTPLLEDKKNIFSFKNIPKQTKPAQQVSMLKQTQKPTKQTQKPTKVAEKPIKLAQKPSKQKQKLKQTSKNTQNQLLDQLQSISLVSKKQYKQNQKKKTISNSNQNNKNKNESLQQKTSNRNSQGSKKSQRKKMNPNEIIQKNIQTKISQQLTKLQYIGAYVTHTCTQLSKTKLKEILWQVPCFLLYKQFYISRENILDRLVIDAKEIKSANLNKYAEQLKQQNLQIKQSLLKLLKLALKKVKKYDFDQPTLEEVNSCLNLDFSSSWHHKLDSMIANFIMTLQEQRNNDENLFYYEIELIDAYLVAKKKQFDCQQRKQIDEKIAKDPKCETIHQYFEKKMEELCELVNKK